MDGADGRRAVISLTACSPLTHATRQGLPATLLLEAMAQAALALMATDVSEGDVAGEAGQPGLLVGIDQADFSDALIHDPPGPGVEFYAGCQVRGRFGRMAKVGVWIEREGLEVATAELLLAAG